MSATEDKIDSKFDFHLGRWEKLSTILIGLSVFALTFYSLFLVEKPTAELERLKFCATSFKELLAIKLDPAKPENDDTKIAQAKLLSASIKSTCPNYAQAANNYVATLEKVTNSQIAQIQTIGDLQNLVTKLQSEIKALKPSASPLPKADNTHGFVSIGPARPGGYVGSNFRYTKTGEKALKERAALVKGEILTARWSVNLRKNFKNTESGDNPSLGIIYDEQCVELLSVPVERRGNYWAEVKRVDCPSGG
jgi:hypothetical protein